MPISRTRKAELIASYKEFIENSHAVLVGEYRGISVAAMDKMRHALRNNDAQFVVAKKTLMIRALQEAGKPVPEAAMIGPVGFVFLGEDISAGAKVLKDFVKEVGEGFGVHGGILGDSVLDAAGAVALADLPSRDVQLAQLVGAISGPMTALVSLISAPHRDLAALLQARIDKEGGETAEAA
ncbi:MAG: 50S ribosomal protein L10 [Chloroflexi bacterium]|nr:50S ribosomal protein L10 [Chloroflexota bacterium]